MPTFSVEGDCHTALARLFEAGHDGHPRFGWSGHSLRPAGHDDLLAGPVRFRDYIMEGFLAYNVQAEDLSPGCRLSIRGEGSNRDQFIRPQVRHYIRAAGLTMTVEPEDRTRSVARADAAIQNLARYTKSRKVQRESSCDFMRGAILPLAMKL